MTEQQKLLQERLNQNYADYITGLQGKTADELIALAPEITAAQQVRDELADACDEDDIAFLLQFDDPLELVRGYWEGEITGYDHRSEMGHMLWVIRDREMPAQDEIAPKETAQKPKMELYANERQVSLIAGKVSNILHGVGQHQQAGEVFSRVLEATTYEEALQAARKYVDIEVIPVIKIKRKAVKKEKHSNER